VAASLAEAEPEKRKLLAVRGKRFGVAAPTMRGFVLTRIPLLCLLGLYVSSAIISGARAQNCGEKGVAVQVLGSGGPELEDKRASSSYLVWQDGQARVLIDAGGGSALRFGESGAKMSQLEVMLFYAFPR
jgi:predicted dienelactone hydrolase